jgi:hypothetical protein
MGGQSSKATFTELIHNLSEKDIDPGDHEFWDELWKTVLPSEEIFEILPAEEVRKLLATRPENIRTVFTQAVAQLYQVVETPYPIYFQQALNCSRVLTRILPFLLESNSQLVKDLLWNKRLVKALQNTASSAEKKGSSSEESENDPDKQEGSENHTPAPPQNAAGGEEFQESEPLGVILVNTIFHLLFLPDFTIEDPNMEFNETDIDSPAFKEALMWNDHSVTTSTPYDSNRIDILRLMLTTFCDSLYQNADSYDSCASLWLEVATSIEAPYSEIVFHSLLNSVLGYDPIGYMLPYGNLVSTDTARNVMESSLQVLIVLLDYGHIIQYDPNNTTYAQNGISTVLPNETQAQGFNVFRRFLATIDSPSHLNFLFQGFVRLLNNTHQAESTYLPYSISRLTTEQELLILFWKCLEEIPKFMSYILKHCDITEILVPICYFLLEGKKDPAKIGLMYLCTFTLLKLSGERNFGVALNKAYALRLPVDVPLFSGNHADLLIIVLHKMIVSGLDKLSALYSCFLTIICNVSPYCKTLCAVSAVKLVNLMHLFVSPNFLYAAEGNHVYVGLLLETFNNIIQYQYEGNGNLIYSIIRRKDIFEGLMNLTLPAAIKTVTELEENGSGKSSSSKSNEKAVKKSKKETEEERLHLDSKPTELISTQNLERRVDHEGEVVDLKTEEADSRTPASPSRLDRKEMSESHETTTNTSDNNEVAMSHRWMPNEKWLQMVKAELPLNTIMRLLKHLVPQIDEMSAKTHSLDEQHVLNFLKSTTMVGLLPVPHPIVIRKYQPNKFTCLWFTAYLWGVIFMHNQSLPLFDGKNVKLFIVQTI